MADDRNLSLGERVNEFDARAFDLDGLRAGLLDEADGVGQARANRAVVAAKGHIGHHKGAARCPANRARVVEHLLHRDGQRVLVAQNHHG